MRAVCFPPRYSASLKKGENMEFEIFEKEIKKALRKYSLDVEQAMKEEVDRCTTDAFSAIKKAAEQKIGGTGYYKKGFRQKIIKDGDGFRRRKIRNTEYQLTHLLENGHIKRFRRGGKLVTDGRVPARPHWAEGQKIADELPERMKKRFKELTSSETE